MVGGATALVASCASAYGENVVVDAGLPETSVDSGGGDAAAESAADTGSPPTCSRRAPPMDAALAASLTFSGFSAGSKGRPDEWRAQGYDRDGRCTTAASTDVCARFSGADASVQEDGELGIDNSWGHAVVPLLENVATGLGSGFLKTDAAGNGSLVLNGSTMGTDTQVIVPVVAARIAIVGSNATLSAFVPREAFVTEVTRLAARFDPSFCSSSTLESILAPLRQSADILQDGTQSPAFPCDAISLGATLTGVVSTTVPAIDAGTNPCAP